MVNSTPLWAPAPTHWPEPAETTLVSFFFFAIEIADCYNYYSIFLFLSGYAFINCHCLSGNSVMLANSVQLSQNT